MPKRAFEPSCAVATRNKFLGARGVGLYLSPVNESADKIVYRNTRVYRETHHSTVSGTPMVFVGAYQPTLTELLNDATLAINKLADGVKIGSFNYTLPAAYQVPGVSYFVQLRPHEAGLELDAIYRTRMMRVIVNAILGTARLVRVVKLDGGGARIDIDYLPSIDGVQPTTVLVRKVTGPTSPADVILTYVAGQFEYRFTVPGLTNGANYEFDFYAVRSAVETLLLEDILVTGDSAGPGALTVSFGEET